MSVEALNNQANAAAQAAAAQAQVKKQAAIQEMNTPLKVDPIEPIAQTAEKLQRAADQLDEVMQNGQRSLKFSIDDATNQVVVTVVDKHTQETIRQIPGPEAIKLAQHLEEMMGLIFNRNI